MLHMMAKPPYVKSVTSRLFLTLTTWARLRKTRAQELKVDGTFAWLCASCNSLQAAGFVKPGVKQRNQRADSVR